MYFIMNRDHTVTSTSGHVIQFKKGQATFVPPSLHRAAIAAGATAHDGEVEFEPKGAKTVEPADPAERKEALLMILGAIKERDAREDFTASGQPKTKVVETMAGFEVSSREIGELWSGMKQADAGEGNE